MWITNLIFSIPQIWFVYGSCFYRCFQLQEKGMCFKVLIKIMFTHKLWQINKFDGNRLRYTRRNWQSSKSLVVFRTDWIQITKYISNIISFLLPAACWMEAPTSFLGITVENLDILNASSCAQWQKVQIASVIILSAILNWLQTKIKRIISINAERIGVFIGVFFAFNLNVLFILHYVFFIIQN